MKRTRKRPRSHQKHKKLERRRLRAAKLFEKQLPQTEIARRLNVSREAVSQWHKAWQQHGLEGLQSKGHPGQKAQLSVKQKKDIEKTLLKGPIAAGYATDVWTLDRIAVVIKKVATHHYHPGHVWYILTGMGWSCQKPKTRAKQRREKVIRRWLRQTWPDIKKKARKLGVKLGFLDETGLSERPTVRRSWAPRSKTPVIRSTGSWKRRSVIGVIICRASGRRPKLFLRIFKDSVNGDKVIHFFKELRRHVKGKIILLWDRLPAHRAKKVQVYLDTQKHWLTVEWFPGYAPELNPVEYMWSAAKAKDWANLYVDSIEDVDAHIRKGGRRFRRSPHLMTSFLKASKLFKEELST